MCPWTMYKAPAPDNKYVKTTKRGLNVPAYSEPLGE